jgi:hypothetical protein
MGMPRGKVADQGDANAAQYSNHFSFVHFMVYA